MSEQRETPLFSVGRVFDELTKPVTYMIWQAPQTCSAINVRAFREGGSGASVNARKNGTDLLLPSDLSLDTEAEWLESAVTQNQSFKAGDELELLITKVLGKLGRIIIQVNFAM